ncbi:DnaJ family domain-containing protein [Arthrobacter sp. NPDC090010]|uniref:DnaJ family domain-containing protein n=1 Tax=Arthrobacter sp. NPDC090010 TaxID=3363942 RepID=UPI0038023EE4
MPRDARHSALEARLERAASLRAGSGGPELTEEELAHEAEQEALREKRAQLDTAARADYLVREAMAQGKFDELQYAGKQVPGLDGGYDPDWWLKGLIQRENLSGLGPEAILLRTADKELEQTLDALPGERQVREALEEFNRRVVNARRQLQGGPPVVTPTRDVEEEVARWRDRRAAVVSEEESPAPEPRRGWWRKIVNGS